MRKPSEHSRVQAAADDVAAAMTRVLAAEREVQQAVEAAREEAQRVLEHARREARAALEHAERTARRIHGRTAGLAARREKLLVAAAEAEPACVDPGAVLDEAVARLARRITVGGDA